MCLAHAIYNDRVIRVNSRCNELLHEFTDHLREKQYT